MKNVLTIDLEDWYQGIELSPPVWGKYEDRVEWHVFKLLEILDAQKTKATFFVLGYVARKYPSLIKEIADAGHEIGSHGYGHQLVYTLEPEAFVFDLKRSVHELEQIIGQPVQSYRAPYFSITRKSLWALDILAAHGITRDSSISPIYNYRYGIPDAPKYMHEIQTSHGSLLEIPPTAISWFGRCFSMTGGFYFRFFPYYLMKHAIQRMNQAGHPAVVYLHPWELDPDQPRLKLPPRISLTHYYNLRNTERKLNILLRDFEFVPSCEVASQPQNLTSIRYDEN